MNPLRELREKDMSKEAARRLAGVREVYAAKAGVDPLDRPNSITGASLRAVEQLAVELETERIRLRELEEIVDSLEQRLNKFDDEEWRANHD